MCKKFVVFMILLALLVTSIVGCQGSDKGSETAVTGQTGTTAVTATGEKEKFDKIITIKGYLRGKETNVWKDSESQKFIEEKFGIRLDLEFSWEYTEKYNLMFAANNLPDFFRAAVNDDAFKAAGDQGQFINYLDYLDQLPNVAALLKEYQNDVASNLSPKGGLYCLHSETQYGGNGVYWPNSVFMVRNDLLKKGGLDASKIKTMDDFYNMLVVLKEQNGTAPIGMYKTGVSQSGTSTFDIAIGNMMGAGTFGVPTSDSYIPGLYWNEETQKYEGSYYRNNQKDWLKFIAKLYAEGMYNADFKTTDKDGLYAQALSGKITFAYMEPARLQEWNEGTEVEGAEWTYVLPVTYEGKSYKIQTPLNGKLYLEKGKAINAKTITDEGLDRLLNMIDWLYTVEGNLWGKCGFEDVDWTWYDEYDESTGLTEYPHILLSDAYKDNYPEKYWNMLMPDDEWKTRPHLWGLLRIDDFLTNADVWHLLGKYSNPKTSLQEEANIAYKDAKAVLPAPNISFVTEYEEERNTIEENITTYLDEIETKILLGQINVDSEWDKIIAKLKELKYDRFIELYNMAFENNEKKIAEVKGILGK